MSGDEIRNWAWISEDRIRVGDEGNFFVEGDETLRWFEMNGRRYELRPEYEGVFKEAAYAA
jgi:hypothetical protein